MADEGGPLKGLRVLDVGTYIFGPAAATVMSDFGAEVIKVEPPGVGDPYRYLHRIPPMPASPIDYCWLLDGRNKRSVVLNLKHEAGREALLRLAETADVLVTNYHPSVLSNLRLTYDDLRARCPRLIFAHATGYGERGEEVEKPGYDMTAWWARSGMMDSVRPGDNDPALSLAGMGDHPSSLALFAGIMLGLYRRQTTGLGTKVSTSLIANGAWSNSCLIQAELCGAERYERRQRTDAHNPLVNYYATADGRRFILCCIQAEKDWPALCRAVEKPEWTADPAFGTPEARREHRRRLIVELDAIFARRTLAEWAAVFARHGVTFSPVATLPELPADAQLAANGVFLECDHPTYGRQRTVANPIRLKDVEAAAPRPAPPLGEATRTILGELGYTRGEIEGMIAAGAAWGPPAEGG